MKIAPIDIAHKVFARKIMGVDPEEVHDFLRGIADEMENIIRERNALRESLREKELILTEYKERDELLKNTITTATRMSDRIHTDAEREAKLILSDANQKADMVVRDARDSLKKIYQEITDLKRVRMQFENNVRALVQSHLTMLDQGNKIMPNPVIEPRIAAEMSEEDEAKAIRAKVNDAVTKAVKSVEA